MADGSEPRAADVFNTKFENIFDSVDIILCTVGALDDIESVFVLDSRKIK